MKKRIFYLQHLIQMILLTRSFYLEFIPLSSFVVIVFILFRIKYQTQGFTVLTFGLIIFAVMQMLGEVYSLVYLQYTSSILAGMLYFVPLQLYWLPQTPTTVGFRQCFLKELHYLQFYPLDQNSQINPKSMKWNYTIEISKMFQHQNISNNLAKKVAHMAMSYADKHRLKVGDGTEEKSSNTSIAFSHGKGGTPFFYSSVMMHFAGLKYRVGGVLHTEKSYIRLVDKAKVKEFREEEVLNRALQLTQVIKKLDTKKTILMGHSYGCATLLQCYFKLEPSLKQKISSLVLLDPWLFPLKQEALTQKINIPILMLANEDFVKEKDVHERNTIFASSHTVEYLIWKDAHHLHQSDAGFVNGNFLGVVKNSTLSRQQMELNIQAIDMFIKGDKVQGTFGDKDLGRNYKPSQFKVENVISW